MKIEFTAIGTPQQRGSKRGRPITRKGGRPGIAVQDDNPKSKAWMSRVIDAAREAYSGDVLTGALRVTASFYFLRPKCHFGTGRNADKLKLSAPIHYTKTPDVDKLQRCLGDAMEGVLYRNDAQIVIWQDTQKIWTTRGPERAIVVIETLDDSRAGETGNGGPKR
ncbi:hypothetical protein LCGC14_1546520 [marine sediment metagenome]|uniref:Uncharacterized protein n=1 Tax=marine sediment metagenome TaxID=412755 RepID=A0A0F9IRI2_9ZZZZ